MQLHDKHPIIKIMCILCTVSFLNISLSSQVTELMNCDSKVVKYKKVQTKFSC